MAKLTKTQKEEIIKLVKQGYKTKAIAARFDVTTGTISYLKDQYTTFGEKLFLNQIHPNHKFDIDTHEAIQALQNKIKALEIDSQNNKLGTIFTIEKRTKKTSK